MNRGAYGYPGPSTVAPWTTVLAQGVHPGHYGGMNFRQNGTSGGGTTALGDLNVWPFMVARDTPIDRIGISITSGVASSIGRVAVWTNNVERFYPEDLIVDSGQFDQSTAADKENIVAGFLPGGVWLWAGYVQSGAAASIRQTTSLATLNIAHVSVGEACGNAGSNRFMWRIATSVAATDAMPMRITAPTESSGNWTPVGVPVPVVAYRAAPR